MSLLYYTSALTLELDPTRCIGCGRCVDVCPHGVLTLERMRGTETTQPVARLPRLRATIAHRERCMECGACALNCASGAIEAKTGVGCAAAIISGMIKGTAPECGCGGGGGCCGNN